MVSETVKNDFKHVNTRRSFVFSRIVLVKVTLILKVDDRGMDTLQHPPYSQDRDAYTIILFPGIYICRLPNNSGDDLVRRCLRISTKCGL